MILKIIGYVIACSLIACIQLAARKHASLKSAEQYPGTVIGHIPRRGSKGRTVYALSIEYQDRVGTTKQFTTSGASSPASRDVGEKVVVFEHANGARPDILIFDELYLGYWIWFCTGIAVAGCLAAPTVLRLLYLK